MWWCFDSYTTTKPNWLYNKTLGDKPIGSPSYPQSKICIFYQPIGNKHSVKHLFCNKTQYWKRRQTRNMYKSSWSLTLTISAPFYHHGSLPILHYFILMSPEVCLTAEKERYVICCTKISQTWHKIESLTLPTLVRTDLHGSTCNEWERNSGE